MEIETKIISIEIVKPSSPTPKSLQKHQLSFLDQIAPPFVMPFVYFYSSNPKIPNSQKSIHLKISLSKTLSRFYPLAGRLVDSLYVDCNDIGTPFAVAEANCNIPQVITNPDPKSLKIFLPYKLYDSLDVCMAIQATYLRCGGLAIGILISHKIADAFSLVLFTNTWSSIAKYGDGGGVPIPKFNAATYFPPLDTSWFKPSTGIMLEEELATRIFTFPASKIAVLRERYAAAAGQLHRRPSRVEALLAFIWIRFVSTSGMKADPNKIFNVLQPINLRSWVDPKKSEFHFGNILRLSMTEPAVGGDAVELLREVREAKEGVSSENVAGLEEGEKYLKLMKKKMAGVITGELVSFSFTSLCRFPLYEVDFGWGKPVWVGLPGFPHKNLVIFKDTKNGDGIEAIIHLSKADMEKFEADLEMQQLKSNL